MYIEENVHPGHRVTFSEDFDQVMAVEQPLELDEQKPLYQTRPTFSLNQETIEIEEERIQQMMEDMESKRHT